MTLEQIATELRIWADEDRVPSGDALRRWADQIEAASPPATTDVTQDIIAAIQAAGTAQDADAVYLEMYPRIPDLPLHDRVLIMETLTRRVARAHSEWV